MKKTVWIVLVCFAIVLVTAAGSVIGHISSKDKESNVLAPDDHSNWETMTLENYYDPERTHLPSDAEVKTITSGMSTATVVKFLGKPHEAGPTSGIGTLVWYTEEGNCFVVADIFNELTEDEKQLPWWQLSMKKGKVVVYGLRKNSWDGEILWTEPGPTLSGNEPNTAPSRPSKQESTQAIDPTAATVYPPYPRQ